MDEKTAKSLIFGENYYSVSDLRYNQKVGIMLSKDEFEELLSIKDKLVDPGFDRIKRLPLKTFNSKHCFYINGLYLLKMQLEYKRLLLSDYELNQSWLFDRNIEDILTSRLFSEVEGTLSIENVPTTHRRIIEISKCENPTELNDIIVKNMLNAMSFIIENKPEFNKENLRRLYDILSKDCLPEELKIKDGAYYRDDKVYIGAFEGADWHIIDSCMDSLFAFANDVQSLKEHQDLLPHICHYYILYIHPYFDYNGRTARMVSFWLSYINNISAAPYFMSEAINENKGAYYGAITDSRTTHNDLTYFLGYILETSVKFSLVYKNLEEIKNTLSKTGDTLTSSEWVYVKKILVHNSENYFNYKMFLSYINTSMSRQGALKILNKLHDYEILEKTKNKKGDTVFKFNPDFITYKYHK
ncbi:MAG: Fic family protein [Clostridia bacterium]|nr:Fic family protein [Clostridia bacterium]